MKSGRLTIPVLYIIIGIFWISFSDSFILWIANHVSPGNFEVIDTIKEILFVCFSGLLLSVLINRSQKKIIQSEQQYRNLYEGNPNPLWFYDPLTYHFVSVNDAAVSRYGYSREEFLKMSVFDIRPPEDIERVKASSARMPDTLHDSGIWEHIKKDGSRIYVHINSHKTSLDGKEVIMVMAVDSTANVLFERQLQELNAALVQQKTELAENYFRLDDTLNSITDSFFTVNRNWIITKANHKFYTDTDVLGNVEGRLLEEVFPGASQTPFIIEAQKGMQGEVITKFEEYSTILNKWLRLSAYPTKEGLAIYFTDISGEKEKDTQLKLALERYELASKATGDVIYDLDLLNDVLIFSQQITSLTGFPAEEVGRALNWWRMLVHPDDLPQLITSQQHTIAMKEKYWQSEYRIRTATGEYKVVYDQGYLQFDEKNEPTRIIGAIKDIDILKKTTEQIKRMGEILNKINIPVLICTPQNVVNWMNPAFTAMNGFNEAEIIGRRYCEVLALYVKDEELIAQLLLAVSRQELFTGEFAVHNKQGKDCWILISLSPIFDLEGRLESYISIEYDITELKEREAEITRQNEKLNAVAWLNSHQIRKPVASIMALVKLVQQTHPKKGQEDLLNMLYLSTKELDEIILLINKEASVKNDQDLI